MKSFRRVTIAALAGALLTISFVAPTPARAGTSWKGALYKLSDGSLVKGSKASYSNGDDEIKFSVRTKGLTEGHAYTIWLLVFNNPDACTGQPSTREGLRCGRADMTNPEAQFSVMYGTGGVAGDDTFEGTRAEGGPVGLILLGNTDGLTNAEGAEVHMRVRDHGKHQPHPVGDLQTTTFEVCVPVCTDVQATGV